MATARRKSTTRKSTRKVQRTRRTERATAAKGKTRSKAGTKARLRTKAKARTTAKARMRAGATTKSKPRAKSTARRRRSTAGRGGFFHIEVQPKEAFVEFKTQDIGSKGGIARIAGKRAGGSWSTQEWVIAKDQAHVERGLLIGDTVDARRVLTMLGSEPRHIRADRFTIHGHTGMPTDASPTLAPRRAGLSNVSPPQKGRKWS